MEELNKDVEETVTSCGAHDHAAAEATYGGPGRLWNEEGAGTG